MDAALKRYGRIHTLVNNAGNFYAGFSEETSGFFNGTYEQDAKPPSGARMGSDNPLYARTLRLLAGKQQNWNTLDAVRHIAGETVATPTATSTPASRSSVSSPEGGSPRPRLGGTMSW